MKLVCGRRFDQRPRAAIYGSGSDRAVEHTKCPPGVVIAVVSSRVVRLLNLTYGERTVIVFFYVSDGDFDGAARGCERGIGLDRPRLTSGGNCSTQS
jgi:hypothetical protein